MDVFDDACTRLKLASDRLGRPVDTAAWRQARRDIVARLKPVVATEHARPTFPPPTEPNGQPVVVPTPAAVISGASAYYPRGTYTGIPQVDRFLRLLYANDFSSLADDAIFTPKTCTTANLGTGTILCPQGVADGSVLDGMLVGRCSPGYIFSRDLLRESLRTSGSGLYLYAVYSGGDYGTYGVALVPPFNLYPSAYYFDASGRLTAIIECGGPVSQNPNAKVLFPPRGG